MSIEKAAEAMWGCGLIDRDHHKWGDVPENRKNYWRLLARAALPHLLEEPTSEEVVECDIAYKNGSAMSMRSLLTHFVRRRNAPPEPPEPAGRYDWHKENWGESPIPRGERWKWVRSHKSSSGDEDRYTVEWVRTAAPPVPDPRREAIQHVLREYPDRAPEIADRILSAIDSLPPVLDPCREVIIAQLVNFGLGNRIEVASCADRILSALDSLKGQ